MGESRLSPSGFKQSNKLVVSLLSKSEFNELHPSESDIIGLQVDLGIYSIFQIPIKDAGVWLANFPIALMGVLNVVNVGGVYKTYEELNNNVGVNKRNYVSLSQENAYELLNLVQVCNLQCSDGKRVWKLGKFEQYVGELYDIDFTSKTMLLNFNNNSFKARLPLGLKPFESSFIQCYALVGFDKVLVDSEARRPRRWKKKSANLAYINDKSEVCFHKISIEELSKNVLSGRLFIPNLRYDWYTKGNSSQLKIRDISSLFKNISSCSPTEIKKDLSFKCSREELIADILLCKPLSMISVILSSVSYKTLEGHSLLLSDFGDLTRFGVNMERLICYIEGADIDDIEELFEED